MSDAPRGTVLSRLTIELSCAAAPPTPGLAYVHSDLERVCELRRQIKRLVRRCSIDMILIGDPARSGAIVESIVSSNRNSPQVLESFRAVMSQS